jgi:hypothetical protein
MKFCKICVRDIDIDIDIDIDRIPLQCGHKLLENEEREKHEIEPDKEKPKVFDRFEINCICSSLRQSEFSAFVQFGGK